MNEKVTWEQYYAIFQTHQVGHAIFCELHDEFVTKKQFDKDPYIHAYNAGAARVIQHIIMKCQEPVEQKPANPKDNIWHIEGPDLGE